MSSLLKHAKENPQIASTRFVESVGGIINSGGWSILGNKFHQLSSAPNVSLLEDTWYIFSTTFGE